MQKIQIKFAELYSLLWSKLLTLTERDSRNWEETYTISADITYHPLQAKVQNYLLTLTDLDSLDLKFSATACHSLNLPS